IGAERASGNRKALVLQYDGVPLGPRRPIARKSPFHAQTDRRAKIVVVAGAGEGGRYIVDREPQATGSYPGDTAFAIEQNTIPSVAKLTSRHRYPSIVEGDGGSVGDPRCDRRVCHVDGVLGIGKPIEHSLRANDEEAPELVIDANLAAAQKRGVRCGPKPAAKCVCCAAIVMPTSAEIAADIEAGPVIGIRRSDRDVRNGCTRWRSNGRRDICCQRGRTTSNAQRDNTRQPFHDDSP